MRFVCVSDTHRQHWKLEIPIGDIFIFAGDAEIDSFEALKDFNIWLGSVPCKYKIVIGGNHDGYLQSLAMEEKEMFFTNAIYLENSSCQIKGIKFWGSPYSPIFNDWAFMKNGKELKKIWDLIPLKTDIVITHCPPFGIMDNTPFSQWPCGCNHLLNRLTEIKPQFHIFGHIHNGSGETITKNTHFINASILDDYYHLVNQPKVFYFEK
jgi:Icc-related predicted phosphoesterase